MQSDPGFREPDSVVPGMIHGGPDIIEIDGCWVIRRTSACQQDHKRAYLFWTGGVWRYDLSRAMRFKNAEAASSYVTNCAQRMAVKSAFGTEELRKIASAAEASIEHMKKAQ